MIGRLTLAKQKVVGDFWTDPRYRVDGGEQPAEDAACDPTGASGPGSRALAVYADGRREKGQTRTRGEGQLKGGVVCSRMGAKRCGCRKLLGPEAARCIAPAGDVGGAHTHTALCMSAKHDAVGPRLAATGWGLGGHRLWPVSVGHRGTH